jgi:hypothetical protein
MRTGKDKVPKRTFKAFENLMDSVKQSVEVSLSFCVQEKIMLNV